MEEKNLFVAAADEVPGRAFTRGIGRIMRSRKIVLQSAAKIKRQF